MKNWLTKPFKNKLEIFYHLIILLILCNVSSFLGYFFKYSTFPKIVESLLYLNMPFISIIALPKSLLDLLHITAPNSLKYPQIYFLFYWFIYVALVFFTFKKKSKISYLIFSIYSIMSAYKLLEISASIYWF